MVAVEKYNFSTDPMHPALDNDDNTLEKRIIHWIVATVYLELCFFEYLVLIHIDSRYFLQSSNCLAVFTWLFFRMDA